MREYRSDNAGTMLVGTLPIRAILRSQYGNKVRPYNSLRALETWRKTADKGYDGNSKTLEPSCLVRGASALTGNVQ